MKPTSENNPSPASLSGPTSLFYQPRVGYALPMPAGPVKTHKRRCILALEDGTVFVGTNFGAEGTCCGEAVFNTAMTGYQEVLTDPSYCGQIVAMTYPHIGNYGINPEDMESCKPHIAGFVAKEVTTHPSNYRSTTNLSDYLKEHSIIGLSGIDTRALTLKLRSCGAMRSVISTELEPNAQAVERARTSPSMAGTDLVKVVAPKKSSTWSDGVDPFFTAADQTTPLTKHVVTIDCGMKHQIPRILVDRGCRVDVVPPTISAQEILEMKPSGVFVSNGPGDPAAVSYAIKLIKDLVGKLPIFGICLGHQLIGLAMGAKSFKLRFGHHGANHPVRNEATGRVEITSQNHGFAIEPSSLEKAGGVVTHLNLNDQTLEGFVHRELPILAVQYHPEASPGPHDATYLFDCFLTMMNTNAPPTAQDMDQAQQAQALRVSTTIATANATN